MRQPVKLTVFVASLLLLLACVIYICSRSGQPVQADKKFTDAVQDLGRTPSAGMGPAIQKANQAMHAMGPDSVPFLIDALTFHDSSWTQFQLKLKTNAPPAVAALLPSVPSSRPELVRAWSATALGEIGPPATNAVPALINALNDNFMGLRNNAVIALGKIAPGTSQARAAVDALIRETADTNSNVRAAASFNLGQFAPDAPGAVSALQSALHDRDAMVKISAMNALSRFSALAEPAVPDLTNLLTDPNETVRQTASNTLKIIHPDALPNDARN